MKKILLLLMISIILVSGCGGGFDNELPVVNAGGTLNAVEGVQTNLAATASDDDGDDLTFIWSVESGEESAVVITDSNSLTSAIRFDNHGSYNLKLVVSDGKSEVEDILQVSVSPADPDPAYEDLYGTRTTYTCTHYASSNGNGDGSSENSPFKIANFWGEAQAGDVLCLMDGVYQGEDSVIQPPEYLSGEEGNPIHVVALHDGKVFINGEGINGPVVLYHNDWFVLEGINAHNAKTNDASIENSIFPIQQSEHVIVRRVIGWDTKDANTGILSAGKGSKYILFEDSAAFGVGRSRGGSGYRSDPGNFEDNYEPEEYGVWARPQYNVHRRVWGRMQASSLTNTETKGQKGFTVGYNSHNNILENAIITIDGYFGTRSGAPGYGGVEALIHDDRQWDKNNRVFGTIAYHTADQRIRGKVGTDTGAMIKSQGVNVTIKDSLVYIEGSESNFELPLLTTSSLNNYYKPNYKASHLTFIGGPGLAIKPADDSIISNLIVQDVNWGFDPDITGSRCIRSDKMVSATGICSYKQDTDAIDYVMFWNNRKNHNLAEDPQHSSDEDPRLIETFGNLLQYGDAQRPAVDGESVGAQIACRYENGELTNKPLWPWPMEERIRVATCMYDEDLTMEECEADKSKGVKVTKTIFELGGGSVPDFEALNPIVCPGN